MAKSSERKRLSEAEGRALVEEWRQSCESRAAFCKRTGMRAHVLSYWANRDWTRPKKPKEPEQGIFFVMSPERRSTLQPVARLQDGKNHSACRGGPALLVILPESSPVTLAQTIKTLLEEVQS